jgi:soluble lytic murein transglycosylase
MLGRAELQQNRLPSAISEFSKATEGDRVMAGQANYYLGISYGRRGNYELAVASLRKVVEQYPDSKLADDAAYWFAYYQELSGKVDDALMGYYQLIKNYPYSQNVPEAIWRLGRIYYWSGDFQNVATYLHLGQLYPAGESSPRCYFFEAKALERLGNRAAALEVYKKLADRFDHSYYSHRARQKLKEYGLPELASPPFHDEDFSLVLNKINDDGLEELLAVMEIWEQANQAELQNPSNPAITRHLAKYRALSELGLASYAAAEARYAVNLASGVEEECSQTLMGEMWIRAGEYRQPIAFAHRKVREAVIHGKQKTLPKKTWQIAYPRGYWKEVAAKSRSFGLDPYLVLAVIREESRFNPKAVSRSSARGLMQIMPRTGRGIAKDLKLKRYRLSRLFEPQTNIEMGSYYLANLVKRFDNNFYLALAGYNGGPNRIGRYVNTWYNGNLKLVDIDEFVESIPVRETRLYVQKVMESYFEYKRIYDRKGS